MPAELVHNGAELTADFAGEKIGMKRLPPQGPRHGAIRADQPQIKAQLAGDGQGEGVTATGDQHDLDSGFVGCSQSLEIDRRDAKLGIEQRAVNVNGGQANRRGHGRILTFGLGDAGQFESVLGTRVSADNNCDRSS